MGGGMWMRRLAAIVVVSCIAVATAPAPTHAAGEDNAAMMDRLMREAGYNYKRASDRVWSIDFTGKSLGKFRAIESINDTLLVMFVIVAKNGDYRSSPQLTEKLARFNHSLDRVKVGIDDDSDLFVRIDLSLRALDQQEVRTNIEQLAAAADEVHAGIKPYLTRR